jgi:hypothetical protein
MRADLAVLQRRILGQARIARCTQRRGRCCAGAVTQATTGISKDAITASVPRSALLFWQDWRLALVDVLRVPAGR